MASLLHVLACASLLLAARAEEEKGHCSALGFGRLATDAGQTLIAHTDDRRVTLLAPPAGRQGRAPCSEAYVAPSPLRVPSPAAPQRLCSGRETTDLRLVRVPAADHPPGSLRPVHFVNGFFPRLVDAGRSPGYAPSVDAPSASQPLGYIPQVAHTYAYWDLNYGAPPVAASPKVRG